MGYYPMEVTCPLCGKQHGGTFWSGSMSVTSPEYDLCEGRVKFLKAMVARTEELTPKEPVAELQGFDKLSHMDLHAKVMGVVNRLDAGEAVSEDEAEAAAVMAVMIPRTEHEARVWLKSHRTMIDNMLSKVSR